MQSTIPPSTRSCPVVHQQGGWYPFVRHRAMASHRLVQFVGPWPGIRLCGMSGGGLSSSTTINGFPSAHCALSAPCHPLGMCHGSSTYRQVYARTLGIPRTDYPHDPDAQRNRFFSSALGLEAGGPSSRPLLQREMAQELRRSWRPRDQEVRPKIDLFATRVEVGGDG